MRRYNARMNGEKFLADAKNNILHNLDSEKEACNIDSILSMRVELPFASIESAFNHKNYGLCPYCFRNQFEYSIKK